jgi:hypothetical protein
MLARATASSAGGDGQVTQRLVELQFVTQFYLNLELHSLAGTN